MQAHLGTSDTDEFRAGMKRDHRVAMEYMARLLRHTTAAKGPVKRHEIDTWLRSDAVADLEGLLA